MIFSKSKSKICDILVIGENMIHYIYKSSYLDVWICEDHSLRTTTKSLNKVLNELCILRLSTLDGMHESLKTIFAFQSKIPLYLGDSLLLFPIKGLRGKESLYINYFSIQEIIPQSTKSCYIKFSDYHEMKCDIFHILLKQIDKCEKILAYVNNQF
jgi:competence transcription factor ComK